MKTFRNIFARVYSDILRQIHTKLLKNSRRRHRAIAMKVCYLVNSMGSSIGSTASRNFHRFIKDPGKHSFQSSLSPVGSGISGLRTHWLTVSENIHPVSGAGRQLQLFTAAPVLPGQWHCISGSGNSGGSWQNIGGLRCAHSAAKSSSCGDCRNLQCLADDSPYRRCAAGNDSSYADSNGSTDLGCGAGFSDLRLRILLFKGDPGIGSAEKCVKKQDVLENTSCLIFGC